MGNADLEVCQGNRLEADNGAGNTSLGSVDENLREVRYGDAKRIKGRAYQWGACPNLGLIDDIRDGGNLALVWPGDEENNASNLNEASVHPADASGLRTHMQYQQST